MAAQDQVECLVEMGPKETRGTRDQPAFRGRRASKATGETLVFLDNPAYQVLMASKERLDFKVYLASLAPKGKLEGLD